MLITSNKVFAHENRVRRAIADFRTPPITLDIDTTLRCKGRCPKCTYTKAKKDAPFLDLDVDLAKRVITDAAQFEVKAVTFTGGGDPVLHPRFEDIVETIKANDMEAGLITSGLDFTTDIAEKTLPQLAWARFSLDAGSSTMYKQTHGLDQDDYSITLRNIENAMSIRERRRLGTTIGASFLVFTADPEDFRRAVAFAQGIGLDYLQFKPGHIPNRQRIGGRYFDSTKIDEARMALEELKAGSPFTDRIIFSRLSELMERTYDKCFGQQYTTSLGADGKLYVCCEYKYDPHFLLGDLRGSTFRQVWESEQRQRTLRELNVPNYCFSGCKLSEINNAFAGIFGNDNPEASLAQHFAAQGKRKTQYPYFI